MLFILILPVPEISSLKPDQIFIKTLKIVIFNERMIRRLKKIKDFLRRRDSLTINLLIY